MTWKIKHGDALEVLRTLPDESVHCCVTSPPYWGLRDYGVPGQLGLESTPDEYVGKMVEVFREVRRVLRKDGTLWLNLGDSYANDGKWGGTTGGKHAAGLHGEPIGRGKRNAGLKSKDLCGIPWMIAFALRTDGWYLRQDIIWAKGTSGERREGAVMPESVGDRCTKSHEYLFLLSKSARYYFDADAIAEPCLDPEDDIRRISLATEDGKSTPTAEHNGIRRGRTAENGQGNGELAKSLRFGEDGIKGNRRSVWRHNPANFREVHFATFPPALIEPCILAGCPEGGTVLDPFAGAGTTGLVATRLNRNFIGIELNAAYIEMANRRIEQDRPLFNTRERETPLRGASPDIWK